MHPKWVLWILKSAGKTEKELAEDIDESVSDIQAWIDTPPQVLAKWRRDKADEGENGKAGKPNKSGDDVENHVQEEECSILKIDRKITDWMISEFDSDPVQKALVVAGL